MNFFTVVRFPNSGCTSTDNLNGTCYSSEECASRGGSSAGTCAGGYGVCCTCKYTWQCINDLVQLGEFPVSINCGGQASENCTYLVSTGSEMGACRSMQWQHLSTEIGLFNLCYQSTRHVNYICHQNGRQKLLWEEPMHHRPIYRDSSWK